VTRIDGGCHCGNIRYGLEWPAEKASITTRVCSCSFCSKHGGHWTSHRDAALDARILEASQVSKYRFGTETADFFVCSRCGGVPFVTCSIAGHDYAVVNANTLEGVDVARLARATVTFEGESTAARLERRARHWIPRVRVRSEGG
jgi:hypothetical protein